MAKARDKVIDAAGSAKPYVDRAIHDEQLRDNLKNAFDAARGVYGELVGGRGVTTVASRVATDKEIQENLKKAVDELRHAADRLQGKEKQRGRNSTLLFTGIVLGVLFNPMTGPGTRKWLRQRLFGGNGSSDFSYEPSSSGNSGNSS